MDGQKADDFFFMGRALEMARKAAENGEVPIGAVLVRDGQIVASAFNQVEALRLGTAHAELAVLNEASRILGAWRLDDCTLYVTKEPCPMCAGAMVNCRLGRLVFGCGDPRTGAAGGYVDLTSMPSSIHSVRVTSGVLADECLELIQGFFQRRRAEAKRPAPGDAPPK